MEIDFVADPSFGTLDPAAATSQLNIGSTKKIWVRFLSQRAMDPLYTLRDVHLLLEQSSTSSPQAEPLQLVQLARTIGPYAVADAIAEPLRREGLAIGPEGEIPYTALLDFIDSARLQQLNERAWTVKQVQDFCADLGLELSAWRCRRGLEASVALLRRTQVNKQDFWTFLEAFDCLEAHRNLFFCLGLDVH